MRLVLTLVLVLTLGGCVIGPAFDKACVEGRLSVEQAKAINELEWEKCPSYREECRAEVNDRILKRKCSEFSRRIFYWF
jgi:hypothetical protein